MWTNRVCDVYGRCNGHQVLLFVLSVLVIFGISSVNGDINRGIDAGGQHLKSGGDLLNNKPEFLGNNNADRAVDNRNNSSNVTPDTGHTALNGVALLRARLADDDETVIHWYPWKRAHYHIDPMHGNALVADECKQNSSINDFPDDLFTQEQRLQGAIILHFIGAIYFFIVSATVVNRYFIPSVECICQDLKLSPDVAAATFMATATSMPELFINTISTFATTSDMGIGTILGSLMFNSLGVAAISGMVTQKPVLIEWWPITRDCFILSLNISVLIGFAWDGRIQWYEAMVLVLLSIVYYTVMFQNQRIKKFVKHVVEDKWLCCKRNKQEHSSKTQGFDPDFAMTVNKTNANGEIMPETHGLRSGPSNSKPLKLWWLFTWPIRAVLAFSVPNPKIYRRLYPLAFLMCIVWLGIISYLIFWMLTIIGYTFGIPESVMGMTFLAAGGCIPEAVTGVVMSRRGEGAMGLSNSLGANSLAILLSLGLPWFIRAMIDGGSGSDTSYINIASYGIEFVILSLLLVVASLYLVVSLAGYRLRKTVGIILLCFYVFFVTFALLVELDVFFPSSVIC